MVGFISKQICSRIEEIVSELEVEPIMSEVLRVGGNNNSKLSWEIGFARTSASASTNLVIRMAYISVSIYL